MSDHWKVPNESSCVGVVDNDTKGENGGTKYFVTQTIHFRTTDSRESFIKKACAAFDQAQANLIKSNND